MYVALVIVALGTQPGSPLVLPIADRVPVINVEKTCKDSAETDKSANIALPQSYQDCMRDENAAKDQLAGIWSTYPASVRASCQQEATLVGEGSYVDLLTCMQMTDPAKLTPTMDLKGASKNRNKN